MAVALIHPAEKMGPDTLEKLVAFLQKRDGIDKVCSCGVTSKKQLSSRFAHWQSTPTFRHCMLSMYNLPSLTSPPPCLQTLKLLRYAAKLSLVSVLSGKDTPLAMQLRSFESSVGTTRWVLAVTLERNGSNVKLLNVPASSAITRRRS